MTIVIRIKWLLDKVVSAILNRLNSRFDRPVTTHHNDGHIRVHFDEFFQQLDAVCVTTLQPNIQQNNAWRRQ